ncbi:coproporphyrinogen dehydrogenase HemZ [Eubacteriales bacterium OttesenSCG-928-N13]|nr:coproporphyrinogen dehydrogenase HemZ [Eubacteriales bacterium OttesenSCG-928-N13]
MSIQTNTPQFMNDLMDVVRLFYPSGEEPNILHEHACEQDQFIERASMDGHEPVIYKVPAVLGGLAEKRMIKRAAKISIYELLKSCTDTHPPWGSLTGIRPTRLFYEAIDQGMTEQQAQRHMSERYDVDEDRAQLLRDIYRMQHGLIEHDSDEFDLYIGIPFCVTRCSYCSFLSGEIGNGKLVPPYIDALLAEMRGAAALMNRLHMRPRACYMGGGTPTSLSASQLDKVLAEAKQLFPNAREWTVEAGRPDTIDAAKLDVMRRHDISRISINPQSFSDETLVRIGRAHTSEDTIRAFELARAHGFDSINMDLICALPGETLSDFTRTLARAIEMDPESITVHTLAIKHGSKLSESRSAQVDAVSAQSMVDQARAQLGDHAYLPYYLYRQKYMAGNLENVGYAKRGHACLYNIDIMEETAPVLALGAGAITKWLFPRERRIERAPNVKNIEQYIARVAEMVERKRALIMEER